MSAPDETAPFFSVIIPTYRRPGMLAEALASVLAQSFEGFEVLVVDDEPSPRAHAVAEGPDDPRVRYLTNPRGGGGAAARNHGAEQARGAWLAFLDDDDVWEPGKLRRTFERIRAGGPRLGLVYTDYVRLEGDEWRRSRGGPEGDVLDTLLYENFIGGFYAVAFERALYLRIGGIDERFPAFQDIDLYVRAAYEAEVGRVPEALARVRTGHTGRISDDPRKRLAGAQLFWRTHRAALLRRPRALHRIAGRVLVYAAGARDLGTLGRALPWVLVTAPADPRMAARALRRACRRLSAHAGAVPEGADLGNRTGSGRA